MRKRLAVLAGVLLIGAAALGGCAESAGKNPPGQPESSTAATEAEEQTQSQTAGTTQAATQEENNKETAQVVEEAPVYVYLTRHGETVTNRTARMVSGRGNTPLTEEGRKVASTVGVGLSGVKFAAAYSSPLGRTQETAKLILSESQTSWDLPVTPVEGLRELDGGSFEPMGYGELMQGYGMKFDGTVEEFQNQFYEKDEKGEAESYDEAKERAVKALKEICTKTAQSGGGNVLVVAHGGINGLIAAEIMGKNDLDPLANSSVVLIEYKGGEYKVLSFNDQSYGENAQKRMENPEPVEVYLMVHAETVTDAQGRMNGVMDSDLTENGVRQAKKAGAKLAEVEFSSVYASDQFKDADTAKYVIGENGKNPNLREHRTADLRGVTCGYFDGELLETVQKVAPADQSAKERILAYATADPTGMVEDYDAARSRLVGALQGICEKQRELGGGNVLIVTSELACQLIAEELGGEAKALEPGSIVRVTYDGSEYRADGGQ